jgi:hypothetical protein
LLYIVIICVYFWVFIFLYFLQSLPWDFYAKIQKGDILLQQFFSVIKREVYITHHCVLYTGNYGNWFFFLHVHQCILYSLITAILYIREILLQIFYSMTYKAYFCHVVCVHSRLNTVQYILDYRIKTFWQFSSLWGRGRGVNN